MAKRKTLLFVAVAAFVCSLAMGAIGLRPVSADAVGSVPAGEVRAETDTARGLQAPYGYDRIELPMLLDGTFDAYALMATNLASASNQETHVLLHVENFAAVESGWYTLGELKTKGYIDGWACVQYGSMMIFPMAGGMPSSCVTGVYLKKGMTFMSFYQDNGGPYDYDIGGRIRANTVLNKSVDGENRITWSVASPSASDEIAVLTTPGRSYEEMKTEFDDAGLTLRITYNSLGNSYENGVNKGSLCVDYDTEEYFYSDLVSYEYDFSAGSAVTVRAGEAICTFNLPFSVKMDYKSSAEIDDKVIVLPFDHSSKFDAYVLAGTDGATNQMDFCSFYIRGVEGKEDGWYTLAELKTAGLVDGITQWGLAVRIFLNTEGALISRNVAGVYLKKGFEFARYTENSTDTQNAPRYTVGGILDCTHVLTVSVTEAQGGKYVNSFAPVSPAADDVLEILTYPARTYSLNEKIDLGGLTLKVTLNSFGGLTYELPSSASYFSGTVTAEGDFSEAGTVPVTVKYGEAQVRFDVEVVDDIESIVILDGTVPSSTEITVMPDLSGMKILVTYKSDASTEEIGVGEVSYDFDYLVAGSQTLTVTYKGKTATKTIEVVDNDPTGGVNFVKGSSVTVEVAAGVMAIRFSLDGVGYINPTEGPYPLYVVDACSNGTQKISVQISEHYSGGKLEIGGWYTFEELKSVKDVNGNPYIGGISQLADSLLIHMESYSWQVNEFTPEDVAAVRIGKGFYFCDYDRSTWGELGHTDYSVLKNGVLKNDLYLAKNAIGSNWIRVLADGEDAMTVTSLPNKTEFVVNEKFDYTGLVVHVRYADGFEEDITEFSPTAFKVDMKKTGEQSVRLNLFEQSVYFTINVTEEGTESVPQSEKTDSGCGLSAEGTGIATLLLLFGSAFAFRKRKVEI